MFKSKALTLLIAGAAVMACAPARSHASTVRNGQLVMTRAEYRERAHAIWMGQMIGQLTGLEFEHKTASVLNDTPFVRANGFAEPDDDYYYEMVALRAFERYGINLTVQQLGAQWLENNAGTWGSSEQTLMLLKRGVKAPDTGSPRYNKLWWTIGPQFSSDIYGILAPGMPNVAAGLARNLTHINGYAEGNDGAVFVSGMISLGFVETDTRQIVRKAAQLISPLSPYRQCLDQVIAMAEAGRQPREIFQAIEDRWGFEYPATNNAVLNGGIVAVAVWFGGGDFLRTENLTFVASDYADTDCNAANAGSVVGAMHGMAAFPPDLVATFNDRIKGDKLGPVTITPPVDESISALGERTAAVGEKILAAHGAKRRGDSLVITVEKPRMLPPELFKLSDFPRLWGRPEWSLERAGFGGSTGGIRGIRGQTYMDGDVLAVFPRDEVRGALLRRTVQLSADPSLSVDVGVDPGRAWHMNVYVDNDRVLDRMITAPPRATHEADAARHWEHVSVDLSAYKGRNVVLRLYDLILVPGMQAGDSYWKNLELK